MDKAAESARRNRKGLTVHLLLLFGQLLQERVLLQLLAHHLLDLEGGLTPMRWGE